MKEQTPVDVPAPQSAPAVPPPAPPNRGFSHRELMAGAGAAILVALMTLVLLTSRGTPEHVAAAQPDAVAPPAATAVAPAAIDTVKWSAENIVHWTGRARNSAAFELHAENTVAIWMRQVRPLLVVRCVSNNTEAFVITDSALKIEADTDDHTVAYSFDDQPETKERWQDAADHNAVFAPEATAFTQRLMHAHTLRFGYTPHNAEPVVAVFHVNGLGALIEPSAKHCGWTR